MSHVMKNHKIETNEEYFQSSYWKEKYKDLIFQSIDKYINQKNTLDPVLESKIPKIRKIIFGDKDFIHLSSKIINHEPQKNTFIPGEGKIKKVYNFKQFFNNKKFNYLSKTFTLNDVIKLKDIIFSKSFYELSLNINEFIDFQFKDFISSIIILSANEYTSLYLPYFYYNVDEETKKNFYINCNDEIFYFENPGSEHNYEVLKITTELLNNKFFSKRFSKNFINSKKFIVYKYLKFGSLEFLLVCFFDEDKKFEKFISNDIMNKISSILSNIYPLFRREDSILFENKLRIISRMVFSYKFFLIRKILIKYKKIIKIKIQFDSAYIDYYYLNKNINFIKTFFQSHPRFIIIRNHFFSLSFFFEDSKLLEEEFWITWNKFSKHLDLNHTITKEKYDINTWSFLEL